jgi:hypothetical protein
VTGKDERPWVAPQALLPTAVALGVLVLVWAAATGPVRMLHESGRTFVFHEPPPSAVLTAGTVGPNLREVTRGVRPEFHLAWIGDLVAYATLFAVLIAVAYGARVAWRRRWHPPEKPVEVEFDVLPDRLVEALRSDLAAQQAAVEEGSPRNGIVACWLRLQQAVTEAGLPPLRSETSAEFVVRALKALDLDPRAISSLAALYREARFSEHEIGEDRRQAARSALQTLHEDLGVRGGVP